MSERPFILNDRSLTVKARLDRGHGGQGSATPSRIADRRARRCRGCRACPCCGRCGAATSSRSVPTAPVPGQHSHAAIDSNRETCSLERRRREPAEVRVGHHQPNTRRSGRPLRRRSRCREPRRLPGRGRRRRSSWWRRARRPALRPLASSRCLVPSLEFGLHRALYGVPNTIRRPCDTASRALRARSTTTCASRTRSPCTHTSAAGTRARPHAAAAAARRQAGSVCENRGP